MYDNTIFSHNGRPVLDPTRGEAVETDTDQNLVDSATSQTTNVPYPRRCQDLDPQHLAQCTKPKRAVAIPCSTRGWSAHFLIEERAATRGSLV